MVADGQTSPIQEQQGDDYVISIWRSDSVLVGKKYNEFIYITPAMQDKELAAKGWHSTKTNALQA
jgi:hypothetical protein